MTTEKNGVYNNPCSVSGFIVIAPESYEVLYMDREMGRNCPCMEVGQACYRGFGRKEPCEHCPARRVVQAPFSISICCEAGVSGRLDVVATKIYGDDGSSAILICYGRVGMADQRQWLEDRRYQTIMQQTKTIAFEFDLETGEHFVSPYISQRIAGNYDGRVLSQVMLEDGVIHPEDVKACVLFREVIMSDSGNKELKMRLKCRDGAYRWFKMSVCIQPPELLPRRLVVGTLTDVDDEIRMQESLRYRAEFDSLTGLLNKDMFLRRATELLKAEPDQPHSIVRLDIDRFKVVNEMFGITEGDNILRLFGKTLDSLTDGRELCARLGNDVFCLCLLRSREEIVRLLEDASAALERYPVDFNFIISAGIYYFSTYDGQPVNILCDRAGLAQRTIKGNFMKQVAFYEDWMGTALSREHLIIGGMKRAIAQQEFLMYLQPKVEISTRKACGAEALVRWRHPHQGMMMPGEFIPIFEKNGFIVSLDEYMWEQACRTLRRWVDLGVEPLPISVNVSRVHLYDTAFCDKISRLVDKYDLAPHLLELEITESAYVENPQSLFDVMERLQKQGFVFLMDDFGSGYSSLSMLKDIPVDILKIDLNFLRQSRRGQLGAEILEATLQMAQRLRFPVIAEGVETEEQAKLLFDAGCTKAQGFYYDRPLALKDFEKKYLGI